MTPDIELIPKEDISKYHFVLEEVIETLEDQRLRLTNLSKARIISKSKKRLVKIVFETKEGIKMVEATILGTDEDEVYLKSGPKIPIICIREVFI